MSIRAVIFDVYKTILDVGPPPAGAGQRWVALCTGLFGTMPRLSLEQFAQRCEQIIAREHAAVRSVGLPFPEIYWPAITREALPELEPLSESAGDEFLFQHAQLQRTLCLMEGAAEVLRTLAARMPLGIASNSQPYTLRELAAALQPVGLTMELFAPDLQFWSFANGFSKPDPHVFRLLTARLAARNISPREILMVGDRLDNDIAPAQAQGWQTWQLTASVTGENTGPWRSLADFLDAHLPSKA